MIFTPTLLSLLLSCQQCLVYLYIHPGPSKPIRSSPPTPMWERRCLPLVYVVPLPWLPLPRKRILRSFTANLCKLATQWTAMKGTLSHIDKITAFSSPFFFLLWILDTSRPSILPACKRKLSMHILILSVLTLPLPRYFLKKTNDPDAC